MHLGIDASNLRLGGGVTHLSRLLQAGDPVSLGFEKVTIWACQSTITELPNRSWLEFRNSDWTEAGVVKRTICQQLKLPNELLASGCDVLFAPGGTLSRNRCMPAVTMSQNMLPFEAGEAARFGVISFMWLKMKLLRYFQGRSFITADGLIFLTRYAQQAVQVELRNLCRNNIVIPHGVEQRFFSAPRAQRLLKDCSIRSPFRFLYVSIVMPYKHQITVAQAIKLLRDRGLPVEIQFIGGAWGAYGNQFRRELDSLDPEHRFLHWLGAEPFDRLHDYYKSADAFVFASSCENLPNIMLEAMAAGLPIASSNRGPMSEILKDAGIYFDPESADSISETLHCLAIDADLRIKLATKAFRAAGRYSWDRCAHETFQFIANTAQRIDRK